MEQPTFIGSINTRDTSVDAYDAVPRDGPAIFIAYDQGETSGARRGRWVDLRLGETALVAELAGHPSVYGWSVVDQLECGPLMVPENPTPAELRELIEWAGRGRNR